MSSREIDMDVQILEERAKRLLSTFDTHDLDSTTEAYNLVRELGDALARYRTASENYQREAFNLSAALRRVDMADGSTWRVCPSCFAGVRVEE